MAGMAGRQGNLGRVRPINLRIWARLEVSNGHGSYQTTVAIAIMRIVPEGVVTWREGLVVVEV